MISGHIAWRRGLLYMLAQILGGIVGGSSGYQTPEELPA